MITRLIGTFLVFMVSRAWAGEDLPTSFVFECPSTSKAFVENLGKLQEQITGWTKTQAKLTDPPDIVLVFAPHLLPKTFPMVLGNKACWVGLNEFREAPSKKAYEYWMACLGNMNLQEAPQVKAINDCWIKITAKSKK